MEMNLHDKAVEEIRLRFPLFSESVTSHQKLIYLLGDIRDKTGASHISQPEMARHVNKSQTWVGQAIRRLNTEDQ